MSDMPDVLARICADKRELVASRKAAKSESELISEVMLQGETRGFARALKRAVDEGRYGLIAEIKKASPSGGLIRPDFDPAALAKATPSSSPRVSMVAPFSEVRKPPMVLKFSRARPSGSVIL